MKNSIGTIVVSVMVGLWFLVSAVSGARGEQPRRPYEELDKGNFPCSEKWWQFPLTRDRVFRGLGLTTEQREETGRLRKQFRDDLLNLKRRHNESLLNVLDNNQRRKLEEKKGEIDRYLRERSPYQHYRRPWPSNDGNNIEEDFNRENWPDHWRGNFPVEVGTNIKLPETNINSTTWAIVKKEFKE